jgi:hypothetical protein
MRIASLDVNPSVVTQQGPDGQLGLTSVESTVTIRLVPENSEEADLLRRVPAGLGVDGWMRRIVELTGTDEPTPSSPPSIAVSVRPQLDGAPSTAQVVTPGVTVGMTMEFAFVGSDGKPTRLHMPLEVRASIA